MVVNYTSPKSQSRAEEVVKAIKQANTASQAVAVQADVTSDAGQTALIDAAVKLGTRGKLDVLVHNAGDGEDCYLKDITEGFYYKQTDLNIKGEFSLPLGPYRALRSTLLTRPVEKAPIFLTQKAVEHIPRGGRIIIISSVSARMGVPQQTVYAATKAANEALARVWSTELGQSKGITVNCVNPGPVATDGYYNSDQDFIDSLKPLIDSTPAAARIGEVEDIAPIVAFLASEEGGWVTGQAISASGGLLFH